MGKLLYTARRPPRLWRTGLVSIVVLLALALVSCSAEAPGGGDRLSIATGGTGGVYYVYGGALADEITQNVEGVEATAESTAASVDNMFLIENGGSDLAFVSADTAADGVAGREDFEEPIPAQVLAQLYYSPIQVVALEGSGIRTIEDLAGRTVSVGAPNSATEVSAQRILILAGIDPEAGIGREQLGVDESVDALRDGTIEAFFWGGGVPTGAISDLASTDRIRLLPTSQYIEGIRQEFSEVYTESIIPAGAYAGFNEEVGTIAVPNFLLAPESLDEELAYQITKVLFEQQEELAAAHPEAENLEIQSAQQVAPLELHPGAQRYFEEAGS
ncbi:MAG: TAXI family TRAP transporter solute-binding subunit [Actinomycetota bacterium]|nr:TAXI family TRAP transporter solute-binding subunit [Actinomycetota bacterium]